MNKRGPKLKGTEKRVKVCVTIDPATDQRLRQTAQDLGKSMGEIVDALVSSESMDFLIGKRVE